MGAPPTLGLNGFAVVARVHDTRIHEKDTSLAHATTLLIEIPSSLPDAFHP